ncbi:MAG: alpha/beta hydrolase family protein [Vulcanimicrobiota bacterium]
MQIDKHFSDIPATLVFKDSPKQAAKRGTIIFYHGLFSDKSRNLKEYYSLADRGFLVIGVDNAGHGERKYPDLEKRAETYEFEPFYYSMLKDTVEEIPGFIDELSAQNLIVDEKIGVCGISMGGYIAFASVLQDSRIKAIAPILGNPVWAHFQEMSPHNHPHKFYPVAVLAQNAGKDRSVSPHHAKTFCDQLAPHYKKTPHKLCYYQFPNSGHFMEENEWYELWENTLNWFEKYI